MNTARFLHDWPQLLARLASDLGVKGHQSGPLWFTPENGPDIVIELLEGAAALALHASLGKAPHGGDDDDIAGAPLAAFLAANAAAHDDEDGLYALDPVDDSLLLFRRFDDAGSLSYEEFRAQIRRFADSARLAKDALPGVPARVGHAPSPDSEQPHQDDFRNLWAQYAHAQGLTSGVPDEGEYILSVEGLGHVFVRPETASGRVLLKTVLTFMPLDNEDPNRVYRGLLQAHLMGEATEGAVFAIDHDEGDLIACRSLPMAGLDSFALDEAINSIAGTAQHMCSLLALEAPTP